MIPTVTGEDCAVTLTLPIEWEHTMMPEGIENDLFHMQGIPPENEYALICRPFMFGDGISVDYREIGTYGTMKTGICSDVVSDYFLHPEKYSYRADAPEISHPAVVAYDLTCGFYLGIEIDPRAMMPDLQTFLADSIKAENT